MSKHSRALSGSSGPKAKRPHLESSFSPIKIAQRDAAAALDADPPLAKLLEAVENGVKKPKKGGSVVYWMRMNDLRVSDNRALSQASEKAQKDGIPLVVLFLHSPQDYIAHDRGARRIDFTLRNLSLIQTSLASLDIPLHTTTHAQRRTLPSHVLSILGDLQCTSLFANIEYEVDELRRDITICSLAKSQGIQATFVHDKCIVDPGDVMTKQDKTYTVYSPYQRNWLLKLNGNLPYYIGECPAPSPNDPSVRKSKLFSALFDMSIPASLPGFELEDHNKQKMEKVWPAGEQVAAKVLERFLHTKSRPSQLGAVDPLAPDAEDSKKHSRIIDYKDGRDKGDRDSTSRLSAYLSAGVISSRACVRATMRLMDIKHVEASRNSGVGVWVQELAWRDFYACMLAAFPRVGMGRPYNEKYADVQWEGVGIEGPDDDDGEADDESAKMLIAWKEGKTGYPIVDAAMRCLKEMGWMHNRMRMITAMFLSKHLMIDWRLGERHFMMQLIDGDLASNNGGWQWCASTGADACPYFRIFNPYSQSLKADPAGEFIRHWVPELAKLRGPDLHNPSAAVADKLGYPRAIVKHEEARERALRRYKNPGDV